MFERIGVCLAVTVRRFSCYDVYSGLLVDGDLGFSLIRSTLTYDIPLPVAIAAYIHIYRHLTLLTVSCVQDHRNLTGTEEWRQIWPCLWHSCQQGVRGNPGRCL